MFELQPYNPRVLRADSFTHLPQGFSFLKHRGFYEAFRETPVHLDISGFDLSVFPDIDAKLQSKGIVIKTLREFQSDPDRDRKVYDLYWEIHADVPQEDTPIEGPDFDEFVEWWLNHPTILHDAYFVAACGDNYVGLSEWGREPRNDTLIGGLLGVRRDSRRQGVGLAMMRKAIEYARENHYPVLRTCTAAQNAPMQTMFNKLGFSRDPEWLQCQKDMN